MTRDQLQDLLSASDQDKRDVLNRWNLAYRLGESEVEDDIYDTLLESLKPEDPQRNLTGFKVKDSRKAKLPIPMFSMDKVKSFEELMTWVKSKKISPEEMVVVTPKYDGLSFLVQHDTGKAYTRGNGEEGQASDEHYEMLCSNKTVPSNLKLMGHHLIGEVIMAKSTFLEKYRQDYRNPRNLVAGLFNSKKPSPALRDVHFLSYGLGDETESKSESLSCLNEHNDIPVPFKHTPIGQLNQHDLQQWFMEWGQDFEIDGLIIELDDPKRRQQLGRETNNNPCYARAWKGYEASSAETTILDHHYRVSKDGRLTAVAKLEPIELDGVTVNHVTLYNAAMIESQGWGIGARVQVIRSGMVIPKIISTPKMVVPKLPETCPSCSQPLQWDKNRVHLTCNSRSSCSSQRMQGTVSFFKVMSIDEVGEKIVEQLYDAGYDTVAKICAMTVDDFQSLDRFAIKRAQLIFNNLHEKLQDVPLEIVQHASGCFRGLGAKRLALCSRFDQPEKKPDLETLLCIDGFSEITARAYLNGFSAFWEFIRQLPITIKTTNEQQGNSDGRCHDLKFCFTGYRDKEAQSLIEAEGGQLSTGVSSKTTHVVAKDPNGASSKLKKARQLNLPIWTPEQLYAFLKG